MKVIYIPKTIFGDFYYDPKAHQGVTIHEDGSNPVALEMKKDFDSSYQHNIKEHEIDQSIFNKLLDAGRRRSRIDVLEIILENFPYW